MSPTSAWRSFLTIASKRSLRCNHPTKSPATVEFVDIAGLVAGASQGEGLGNKFLANIRETDAICEVVRFFSDPNVEHVSKKVDPQSDVETIKTELILGRHRHARKGAASS